MRFIYPEGATPLNYDEINDLIPKHLTTQNELNEWEQFNILEARRWAFKRKRLDYITTVQFAKKLHYKMFYNTWKWAGNFRTRDTNIGINKAYIVNELLLLFNDIHYLLDNNIYDLREIAARFHHRLVFIHPFPNGNGRFSRIFADLLLFNKDVQVFTWGKSNLVQADKTRDRYLNALRAADNNDYKELLIFVDS